VPIGLDGRRHAQIDDVIEQLTREGCDLPQPFSETDLYRTAARVGIPVWESTVKERFTDRVLDQLDYEWDPASRVFTPVIGEQCVEDMKRAARTITSALDADLSEPLRNHVDEWCRLHGIESFDTESARTLVARQAILGVLLNETLSEWCQQQAAVPPRSTENRPARQDACLRTTVLAFDEVILGHIAGLADETALAAVRTHGERLLYSAQPAEDIGWLYEAVTPKACR